MLVTGRLFSRLLRHTMNSDVGPWSSPARLKKVSREDKMKKERLRIMVS